MRDWNTCVWIKWYDVSESVLALLVDGKLPIHLLQPDI